MKLGLVLDLSHAGFAAVLDEAGETVLAQSIRASGTRHEDVGDWAGSLLREAGGSFTDLAWVAVGVGPGSFTGIRIAMAFAQGLALPLGIPLHGFTSFEALFLSQGGASKFRSLAVVPASAGRFHVAKSLGDPGTLVTADELVSLVDPDCVVLTPQPSDALTATVTVCGVWSPDATWNAVAIARHARASGRGAEKPAYLQLSAAEEKAQEKADAAAP